MDYTTLSTICLAIMGVTSVKVEGQSCCRYNCQRGEALCSGALQKVGNVNTNGRDFASRIEAVSGGIEALYAEEPVKDPSDDSLSSVLANVESSLNNSSTNLTYEFESTVDSFIADLQTNIIDVLTCRKTNCSTGNQHVCFYQTSCFWLLLSYHVDYHEATAECARYGGVPANVYSARQYEQWMEYLRMIAPDNTELYLGMTYNHATGNVLLSTGAPVTYDVRWFPSYPEADSTSTALVVSLRHDAGNIYQNFWNLTPDSKRDGVLCEKTS